MRRRERFGITIKEGSTPILICRQASISVSRWAERRLLIGEAR